MAIIKIMSIVIVVNKILSRVVYIVLHSLSCRFFFLNKRLIIIKNKSHRKQILNNTS